VISRTRIRIARLCGDERHGRARAASRSWAADAGGG